MLVMSLRRPTTDFRRGFTFVEALCASVLMGVVLLAGHLFLFGSLRSLGVSQSEHTAHAQFLALQEVISRDVREAAGLVGSVTLDADTYAAGLEGTGDTLILKLPCLTARETPIPNVYDFIVYTVEPHGAGTGLVRRVFATRSASGAPVTVVEPVKRRTERWVLVRDLRWTRGSAAATPVFLLDQPVVSLAREVTLEVTVLPAPAHGRYLAPQTYTTRLRMRNSS